MIRITRTTQRESSAHVWSHGKNRSVVVVLDPSRPTLVGFRLKTLRRTYYLAIDDAYRAAVRGALAAAKLERAKARKQAQKGR